MRNTPGGRNISVSVACLLCYVIVTMLRLVIVLYILSHASFLAARELPVCVDNQAGVDPWTVRVMKEELAAILSHSGFDPRFVPCPEGIRLALSQSPPPGSEGALGAARRDGSAILPQMAVYAQPVARLIGTTLPAFLGKAMARVATHEIGHYLRQSADHSAEGPMTEYFAGPKLIAARSRDFQIR